MSGGRDPQDEYNKRKTINYLILYIVFCVEVFSLFRFTNLAVSVVIIISCIMVLIIRLIQAIVAVLIRRKNKSSEKKSAGQEKYIQQLDSFLESGIIDKTEYRKLKKHYENSDIS